MKKDRYELQVLQRGGVKLRPDGRVRAYIEHLCTSVVLWPEGTIPDLDNSLIVDPCFNKKNLLKAAKCLEGLGGAMDRIGRFFVTHNHWDHLPNNLVDESMVHWVPFSCDEKGPFPGVRCHPCPGHSADSRALVLDTQHGQCWIVGDAIIDKDWLLQWCYYWPNGYNAEQVVQTWRSVASILSEADVIVPGHGNAFRVTIGVVEEVLFNWPRADFSSLCPGVEKSLRLRLESLKTTHRVGTEGDPDPPSKHHLRR
jgi:glyoxylase-like metal-dependent hydrolase (beta-lactamase superfamily II)